MSWSGGGAMNYQLQPIFKKAKNNALAGYDQGMGQINKSYDQAVGYQQPWYDAGQNWLKGFQDWQSNPNGVTQDPSYQWRLGQGTQALENSATARGGLLSGNTAKGITDYAQNAASHEYMNQFARWMQQLGIGQNASSNMSNLAVGRGNALANLMVGRGNTNFNDTLQSAQEIRQAELGFNNILQSWVPASAGGGKPTTAGSGSGPTMGQVDQNPTGFNGYSVPSTSQYSSLAKSWGG